MVTESKYTSPRPVQVACTLGTKAATMPSATGASMPARPRRSPPAAPRQIGQAQYSTTGTVISKAAQFISTMAQSSVASASAGMPSLRT
ncbi:Uncharacterised protein [Bordetella pertussis]|nr:Uncharacterised protein [Bordetella pertussis]CFO26574.1 Uncharacterised protein [Bordetella pertussis]CFP09740.1 Uncharacterised protein [Bordetella pertussis]CFW28242.1 Uncharacterised protein [Bordetella pertussis]CFW47940.1 Uncharacterised protein [Bordetella pertussis]